MKKQIIRDILKVMAVGGAAALLSSAVIGLMWLAVWIFCIIPSASGYLAVMEFALALLTTAAAFAILYMSGCWITHKGKFAR